MNASNLYTGIFYSNVMFGVSSLLLYHKRTQICLMREPEKKNPSTVSICGLRPLIDFNDYINIKTYTF